MKRPILPHSTRSAVPARNLLKTNHHEDARNEADQAPATYDEDDTDTEEEAKEEEAIETAWLRNLLRELHSLLSTATLVYCDNVRVLHVPSRYQYADIFTKGLPSALYE
ncbi:hypothetical protein Tco_0393576 [Tanacetum coccineum]